MNIALNALAALGVLLLILIALSAYLEYEVRRLRRRGRERLAEERANPNSLLNLMEAYEKEYPPAPLVTKELHKKTFTFTKGGVYLAESITQLPIE